MLTASDVFISYSHHDSDWVRSWLLPRLEAVVLKVCIDVRDFEVGVPSIVNMENAVKSSRKTLLVMTPNWTISEWTDFESLLTQTRDPVGRKRRLVPIMLQTCDLPDRLSIFTYADFTDAAQWETQLARVIAAINDAPGSAPSAAAVTTLLPNLVHPYPLQANFTGRLDERKELSAWLNDDEHPIYELVAMGGMGKSALTWYWLTRDVLGAADVSLDGVMWWSFYEGESSFAAFVDDGLKYVSGQPIDTERLPTTYDRAQELRRQLQAKRVLFVLDGFERQLRDYASLDATYQTERKDNRPREARGCVDPNAARLLREFAAGTTRAKVLLTTRLAVSDLEDQAGDALAAALKRELNELGRDDAVAFMRAQGVTKGTTAEIAAACTTYGYHPLSLRLLSGLIARDPRTPRDIAAAPRHDVHDDLIQRQHHVLERSYDALRNRGRALISRISAFRGAADFEVLEIFRNRGEGTRFEATLDDLLVRGLLLRDTTKNRYDLHPIVRRYCYDRLNRRSEVHERLREHFARIPIPANDSVNTIEELASVIELYHHTVHAGLYDSAEELLKPFIAYPLYFRFGAYQLVVELEQALFPDGEDCPPRLEDADAQAWMINSLANAYSLLGQPRRAKSLFEMANRIYEEKHNNRVLAIGLGNLASMSQMHLGELGDAESNLRRSIELSKESKFEPYEAAARRSLGLLLTSYGRFDEAERELRMVQLVADDLGPTVTNTISVVRADRAVLLLFRGDAEAALEAAKESRELANIVTLKSAPHVRDIIRSEWAIGVTLIAKGKHLNDAADHLSAALIRCRRINLVELEPDILLALAHWHRAKGNAEEAQSHADDALEIADRCEYRLKQADIHNFLAQLALDAGNRELARQHAEIAKERAWCDGPPHCYKPALDQAEAMLKAL